MDLNTLNIGDTVRHRRDLFRGDGTVTDLHLSTTAYSTPMARVAWDDGHSTWPLLTNLIRVCKCCRLPEDAHDELTGKCLFGAGVWA